MLQPTEEQARIIRERVAENPNVMLMRVAKELDMPEAAAVAALPEEMRVPAPSEDFVSIWETMTGWEQVLFLVVNDGVIAEVKGRLPKGEFGHGFFNIHEQDNPIGGHIRVDEIGAIWLVSKPMFNLETHSVQIFDKAGKPMFSVYMGRDEKREILPDVLAGYRELRARYEGAVA